MGLSGNKAKQRIQDDPRNLRWATDTAAPGYRLLASMGWDPESKPSLGLTAPTFTKKIAAVPVAKDDMLGLGARKPGAASAAVMAPRSMMSASNGSAKMGFVSASSSSMLDTEEAPKITKGGEFGNLLARLNSQTPASSAPSSDSEQQQQPAAARSVTVNPRIASRAKHLKSKRMAASNALAMSEILGIAPPAANLNSRPLSSGSASPAPAPVQPLQPPTKFEPETAPVAEPAKPKFPAFSSGSSIPATFDVPSTATTTVEPVGLSEKEQRKAEKRKAKEAKRLKKEAKKLNAAQLEQEAMAVEESPVEQLAPDADNVNDDAERKDKKRKKKRKKESSDDEDDKKKKKEKKRKKD